MTRAEALLTEELFKGGNGYQGEPEAGNHLAAISRDCNERSMRTGTLSVLFTAVAPISIIVISTQ